MAAGLDNTAVDTVNNGEDDHGEEDDKTEAGDTAQEYKEDVFYLQDWFMKILSAVSELHWSSTGGVFRAIGTQGLAHQIVSQWGTLDLAKTTYKVQREKIKTLCHSHNMQTLFSDEQDWTTDLRHHSQQL